ncbi:MAG TPA: methyltransferase domain-containing protein [Chloroflexota bacterium]|nr:methyltransferase domain-containing protein [Chloroflexota bacterium]HUM67758.1 methyltransferase domain-containing protein [Chloroflexota bacterium]
MTIFYFKDSRSFPQGEQLKKHILQTGCYSENVNLQIYNKYFTCSRPRDLLFNAIDTRYGFSSGTVCDAGCEYGMHLARCAPGSYGIEIERYSFDFAKSIGLTVYNRNIVEDDLSDLPRVDAVWTVATMEHTDAPHIFLRKLYHLLKPNGLLIVEVPVRRGPPLRWLGLLPISFLRGLYIEDHADHVNAFTPLTLRHFCELAGFKTIEVFMWSVLLVNNIPSIPLFLTKYLPLNMLANDGVYIGRKIPDWDYPTRAARRSADNRKGFEYVERIP